MGWAGLDLTGLVQGPIITLLSTVRGHRILQKQRLSDVLFRRRWVVLCFDSMWRMYAIQTNWMEYLRCRVGYRKENSLCWPCLFACSVSRMSFVHKSCHTMGGHVQGFESIYFKLHCYLKGQVSITNLWDIALFSRLKSVANQYQ